MAAMLSLTRGGQQLSWPFPDVVQEATMFTVRYGGKAGPRLRLVESARHVVVRTVSRAPVQLTPLSRAGREVLSEFRPVARFRRAGVEVFETAEPRRGRRLRDAARTTLKRERTLEFAGRVLVDRVSEEPVVYTENFFVKFYDDESVATCRRTLAKYRLTIKRALPYARNAYFVGAPENTGLKVFAIGERVLNEPSVEFCHPELVREVRRRAAFPGQWHLKRMTVAGTVVDAHASVEAAWALSEGAGVTIAVIDDGVDLDHEEFASPGKIVAPRDVTFGTDDPRPGTGDNHGTACAGVAAANGRLGAAGVAPAARLMPIRSVSDLGSQQEADAFQWAADHGADVVSCSWGPRDGRWWDASDPWHAKKVPLPDSTRLAIDYAVAQGRSGRGCVITWAAGNGNEPVDNDGYASYGKVIAVAACNDSGRKSAYSDFGEAVWCAFPSNDGVPAKTPGIFTTDRMGSAGYNEGQASLGDPEGDYTNDFGGTSSACPGVAGVAALILARNPNLRWDEVKDIIKRSCDRIDTANGQYDTDGHSPWYGYGRVNARTAVELAVPAQPGAVAIRSTVKDVRIRDFGTARLSVAVADTEPLTSLKVRVEIEHTYIGDLVVTLTPPGATGVPRITLHNREGGGMNNLKKTYDAVSTPGLQALVGKSPKGTWRLAVSDRERADQGLLKSITLELGL
jgi:subtilisin family serine protease